MAKKSEHRDLFPGALELMILKSLSWRPMHGYALAQRKDQMRTSVKDFIAVAGSAIAALKLNPMKG